MNLGISFAPLLPSYVVWTAMGVAIAMAVLLVLVRSPGATLRIVALALLVLALTNPSSVSYTHLTLPTIYSV